MKKLMVKVWNADQVDPVELSEMVDRLNAYLAVACQLENVKRDPSGKYITGVIVMSDAHGHMASFYDTLCHGMLIGSLLQNGVEVC